MIILFYLLLGFSLELLACINLSQSDFKTQFKESEMDASDLGTKGRAVRYQALARENNCVKCKTTCCKRVMAAIKKLLESSCRDICLGLQFLWW